MSKSLGAVILAAGEGTRLKSSTPKPLIELLGKKMVEYPLAAVKSFMSNGHQGEVTVVTGHRREEVESHISKIDSSVKFAFQEKQLGTADALKAYFHHNKNAMNFEFTLICCADTPLLADTDLELMASKLEKNNWDGIVATFETPTPRGYGRIIHEDVGFRIVEEKDASDEEKEINEVNSGLYLVRTKYIKEHLNKIDSSNNSKEFYLTDLFQAGRNVGVRCFADGNAFFGVNDYKQLGQASRLLQKRINQTHLENGVRLMDANHTYIDSGVEIGVGTVVSPMTELKGNTKIGMNCRIALGSVLEDSTLEDDVVIKPHTYLESSIVRKSASIGPFAHLRPSSDIGEEAKIGNFVETKKVKLEKGVKVSHLSYVGDAEIGENTNIGCGFITCNYDGAEKHLTKIGKDCFIGSDTQVIAPIELGDEVYVGSGSTINKSVPSGALAIARARQENKEDMARRFIKKKK